MKKAKKKAACRRKSCVLKAEVEPSVELKLRYLCAKSGLKFPAGVAQVIEDRAITAKGRKGGKSCS